MTRVSRRAGSADGVDDHLDVLATRVRAERRRAGLSLRGLAAQLDLSASALSQIETGRSHPSVASLYAIASALGVPLDSLFERETTSPPIDGHVQRAHLRPTLQLESGVRWERLTTAADGDVDFLYVVYAPGGESSHGLISHGGREYGLVLEGRLSVTVGPERYVLGPGDAICLESATPHRLANDGAGPAVGVWVVVHRS